MSRAGSIYINEKGVVFPVALAFLAILALLGATAVVITTLDIKIGGSYKASARAFYAAQAGIEEARARLRANAADPIVDSQPSSPNWRAYIGIEAKAQGKGYDPSQHGIYTSLQSDPDLDYTVMIEHQTDTGAPPTGQILYWGDSNGDGIPERNITIGEHIYLITSYGAAGDLEKTVKAEITRLPPVTTPSALYVEADTTVQGSSTHIIGTDGCGGSDKPGIVTTQDSGSITLNGSPEITGEPNISYTGTNMDIESMVDSFKELADFTYTVNSTTHTASTTPGPGDDWGTPIQGATLQDPSSCGCSNIVHYNTNGTFVRLSGGVSGCGILLVEGDLEMSGNFSWNGIIIATGSVTFTGGGNKNITGALLAGESADADLVGGNSNIVYCSSAINNQTQNRALRVLTWKEEM